MLTNFLNAHYEKVLNRAALFDKIYDYINNKSNWGITEFILLYALILNFKPDCILELGRCCGNSLYTISIALDSLNYAPKSVISICLTDLIYGVSLTVEKDLEYKLNQSIEIVTKNFLKWDYSILRQKDNILIFYDIHGAKPMRHFLNRVTPLLKEKKHIVIFHDFSYGPTLTKEKFYQRRKEKPTDYSGHYYIPCGNTSAGGFIGFAEAPILIKYIKQADLKIGFPYSNLSLCLEQYYREALERLSNYRKGSTSLITVSF